MWDLTVDGAHSFFVGSGQVLVHNACDIDGTIGLQHSFDSHAAQFFGHDVSAASDMAAWQRIVERGAQSRQVVPWSVGGSPTIAHLAQIDGKQILVQFFADGPRMGELATAFVPNQSQLSAIYALLRAGH